MTKHFDAREFCKHETQAINYGLGGGGCGAYVSCEECGAILSKEQDEALAEHDPSKANDGDGNGQ